MSNRRRIRPQPYTSAAVVPLGAPEVAAARYTCGHCRAELAVLSRDARGVWHLDLAHDGSCPVLAGRFSDMPDLMRALAGGAT